MFNLVGDHLEQENPGQHGSWIPDKKYQVWNPWVFKWEDVTYISYHGLEFHVGPVAVAQLNRAKVREANN
jgi:hypothetical protein